MSARHAGRRGAARVLVLLVATAIAGAVPGVARAEDNPACALVTAAELEAALGVKVTERKPGGTASASGALCSLGTPTAAILLRTAKRASHPAAHEAAGVEQAKKMGVQVDVQTSGPITCSTLVPPPSLAHLGYNTTCSVDEGGSVAAIEVTAKAAKDMVPIERLRPLAEKMAARAR